VRSLRSAFVEVYEELEAKFPDYEAHSKEHSQMSQVRAASVVMAFFVCGVFSYVNISASRYIE